MSSSESEAEPALRYGTPLEPYEEDEVPSKRKYQQASDQHAVDAHGRRRFHGAFMGGFTAGHGNTVSTPEGWTPATFKSSRSDRGSLKTSAPQDFMDEEDRGEFGIAPRLIQTQSDFTSGHKRTHLAKKFHDGPIPGEPVLEQFLHVIPDTAAVRLLKAMGWRPGQGVGEKRSKSEKDQKVYGCYVPPEFRQNTTPAEDTSDSDTEYNYSTLFAPEDYEPYLLSRKSDQFGLGYSGLSRHSVLGGLSAESSISHLKMSDKGKKVSIRGQAFGVGALEEEDEDIYAGEDMSHYDFVLGGTRSEPGKQTNKQKQTDELEGFVRASKPMASVRSFPPPALPRDYRPSHISQTRFTPAATSQVTGRHDMTANARGAFLGESPVLRPSEPNDEQSSHEDAVAKLIGRNVNFVPNTEIMDTNDNPARPETINSMDKIIGRNVSSADKMDINESNVASKHDGNKINDSHKNTNTFKPFSTNQDKQERYERFLRNKELGVGESIAADKVDRLTEWERSRELVEFEQASKLYKPLTGIMHDRFTHATEPDTLNPLMAVLPSSNRRGAATEQQQEAARMGLHGKLTRSVIEWRPESLLCKRFNIPDPFGMRTNPKDKVKPKSNYSIFDYLEGSIHNKESFTKEQTQFSGSKSLMQNPVQSHIETNVANITINNDKSSTVTSLQNVCNTTKTANPDNIQAYKRITVTDLFLMEAEKERLSKEQPSNSEEVPETIEKFDKMELYKAIFLSDSEEEDIDKPTDKADKDFVDKPLNVERNDSPPRGIFANVDFEQLNSWSKKKDANIKDIGVNNIESERDKCNEINNEEKDKKYTDTKENDTSNSSAPSTSVTATQNLQPIDKPKHNNIDIDELFNNANIDDGHLYGPKIPDNLKKSIETSAFELEKAKMLRNACVSSMVYRKLDIEDVLTAGNRPELPKPIFRDRNERKKEVIEVNSSSEGSWVDAEEVKSKKHTKKKKKKHKHKSKHKKNKK